MRNTSTPRTSPLFGLALSIVSMGAMGVYFALAVSDLLHLDRSNGAVFLLLVGFGLSTYPVVRRVVRYVTLWESQRHLPFHVKWRLIAFFAVFAVSLFFAQVEAQQSLGKSATVWDMGISVAWIVVSFTILALPAHPQASRGGPVGADLYVDDDSL